MDTEGARHLRDRIAQHQQWCLAEAVQKGEQPPSDPDADRLEEIGEGYRLYEAEVVRGDDGGLAYRRLRKTLVDGRWHGTLVDADQGQAGRSVAP